MPCANHHDSRFATVQSPTGYCWNHSTSRRSFVSSAVVKTASRKGSASSSWFWPESESSKIDSSNANSNATAPNPSKHLAGVENHETMGDKDNDDDDGDDDDDDDDDDHDVKLSSTNGQGKDADGEPPVLKMSILKKRYKGSLKRLLEEKHAIIIDKKKQAWLSPWKLATMIHCLDTNQDYSLITKRPGPTPKEIEAHVFQQGMMNTKQNRQTARLDLKRKHKRLCKQLLERIVEERGAKPWNHPASSKSDWQELYIVIQESILNLPHTRMPAYKAPPPPTLDSKGA